MPLNSTGPEALRRGPSGGSPSRSGRRSSGTAISRASGCGSIPRAPRPSWCRAGERAALGASPSGATGRSRPARRGSRRPASSPASSPGTKPRPPPVPGSRWRSSPRAISRSTSRSAASRGRRSSIGPRSDSTSCPPSAIPRFPPSAASRSPPCTTRFARRPTPQTGPFTSSPGSSTWPRTRGFVRGARTPAG